MIIRLFICLVIVINYSQAFAFNCTSLQGAEQRLRDKSFAQPLAAYYLHLFESECAAQSCDVDDEFIEVLNLYYKASCKTTSYDHYCSKMLKLDHSRTFFMRMQQNTGFSRIHEIFAKQGTDYPTNGAMKLIINNMHDSPSCLEYAIRTYDNLSGYYNGDFRTYFFIYLFDNPDRFVTIGKSFYLIKENIIEDIHPHSSFHNPERIRRIYAEYFQDGSEYKEEAEYIVSWFEEAYARWEASHTEEERKRIMRFAP